MTYTVHRHKVEQPNDPAIKLIPLTKGMSVTVDSSMYDWLNQWNWTALKTRDGFVAVRRIGKTVVAMHQILCPCFRHQVPDHINGNTLDNRLCNLRPAFGFQNRANKDPQRNNTSGYKGVTWDKNRGLWKASIKYLGRMYNLGRFSLKEDAAHAYDRKALEFFGEFARTNFPPSNYQS